jgi:hypothetical protein
VTPPFDLDVLDADFRRPAVTIRITNMATGEKLDTIELPELTIPASEISPEWLALHDAEQAKPDELEEQTSG